MDNQKILRGKDLAQTKGHASMRQWYAEMTRKGYETPFRNAAPVGPAVQAFIDHGRWVAVCECGGAEAVDPEDPFFYCLSCGNDENEGFARPLIVPDNYQALERELLKRPIARVRGRNAYERMTLAIPMVNVAGKGMLSRSWTPGETLADLEAQNKAIKKGNK